MKTRYLFFDKFVFRTPFYPVNDERDCRALAKTSIFKEAIFLGSPDLYRELTQDGKKGQKVSESILKYFNRSHTRCTPFGLFAGCSMGHFADSTDIRLVSENHYQRCTRLDMNYLCTLIQYIEKQKDIQLQLLYYPNDSIYKLGDKFRYVEYYYRDTKRVHQLNSVEYTDYLDAIFTLARSGARIGKLAAALTSPEITQAEAEEFVFELIDSQLLKSELDASVTGDNQLSMLIRKLQKLNNVAILPHLLRIADLLDKIDQLPVGESLNLYNDILGVIKEIGVAYESKYLFQTDLLKPSVSATLSKTFISDIHKLIRFYNRVTPSFNDSPLAQFATAFYERYEEQEISLVEALDSEVGISYPITTQNAGDVNKLIDDLFIRPRQQHNNQLYFSRTDDLLLAKYVDAIKNQKSCIDLTDDDFPDTEEHWDDLPETMTLMCSIIDTKSNGLKLHIKSLGGPSGIYILGRFCHLNPELYGLARDIADKEQNLNSEAIVAEIVHLPESRIGNIAFRPLLRDYEIHYMAQANVDSEKQITIEDLTISVKKGEIILRSKKLKKRIIPRLSNAHNFRFNSMPIYHFLCDLQNQHRRVGLGFRWGELFNRLSYLPRVQYNGHVLCLQTWNLDKKEFDGFAKMNDEQLTNAVKQIQRKYALPDEIIIPEGDNELCILLTDMLNVRTMLSLIKNRNKVSITENLFNEDHGIVKNFNGKRFTNEFVMALYKTTE